MKFNGKFINKGYLGNRLVSTNGLLDNTALVSPFEIPVDWLKFTATTNSSFGLNTLSSNQTIEYSLDDGLTWASLTTNNDVTLNSGEYAYLRGKLTDHNYMYDYTNFKMSGEIDCSGNIMYLYDYDSPGADVEYDYAFYSLFKNCTALYSVPDLPALHLIGEVCYGSMFEGCDSISLPPRIEARTLSIECCESMFYGCSFLSIPPVLHATELAEYCYDRMFYGCEYLQYGPDLNAIELKTSCYSEMFVNCYSMESLVCLAIQHSTSNSTYNWMLNAGRDIAYEKFFTRNMQSYWSRDASGVPTNNWTIIGRY